MDFRRFVYKGEEAQLPEVEAVLKEKGIDRRAMYAILKNFEINPGCAGVLEQEFPNG